MRHILPVLHLLSILPALASRAARLRGTATLACPEPANGRVCALAFARVGAGLAKPDRASLHQLSVGVVIFGASREGIFVVQGPEIADFRSMYDLLQVRVDVLIFDDCVYVQSFLLSNHILILLGSDA